MDFLPLDDINSHLDHLISHRRELAGLSSPASPPVPYRVVLGNAFGRAPSPDLPERQDSIADRLQSGADDYQREAERTPPPAEGEGASPTSASVKVLLSAAKAMLVQNTPDAETVSRLLY